MSYATQSDPRLPTGTVTYLLADIEGSVRLWEGQTAEMGDALARHDQIVGNSIDEHGGYRPIEQGEGDSFLAVFMRATDALACALDLQRRLRAEPWPGSDPIKVRMAMHTGEAQLRGGIHYVGRAVNRCARLRDMTTGGQVVLSQSTYELAIDRLPEGASLRHLGSHRLRDLERPERVWQLIHPDLPSEFPPLRSLDAMPNNLPLQLTSFIGRQSEIAKVKELLENVRLVTITGAGGCGKTRLALQIAADLMDEYPDGAWLVDLAPLSEPELVAQAVLSTLGVQEEQFIGVFESLIRGVGGRKMLIVLDNCEHLISSCASLAEAMLKRCPNLIFLATSREPLGVPGENPWRVPSLALPDDEEELEPLATFESVQLFADRASSSRPNFRLTDENAPSVAAICRRLEGIPLAIELAAARIRALTPQQICDGLNDRLRLLAGGARTTVPRHQTLQASVDWSYDLLSDPERLLFRRMSVFAGGFTLEAAEEICAGGDLESYQVLDILFQLVDKSLVSMEEQDDVARYRLLGTIRQYGSEKLESSGEGPNVHEKHRDYFLRLAEEAAPHLTTRGQDEWLTRLQAERDNLRAALRWGEQKGASEAQLRMVCALLFFWMIRGHGREGRRWLEGALGGADDAPPIFRAEALWALGHILYGVFDIPRAVSRAQESLSLAQELGDKRAVARAQDLLGWIGTFVGGLPMAKPLFDEAVELARASGDEWTLAHALQGLGNMYLWNGDPAQARRYLEESIVVAERAGDRFSLRGASVWLGGAAMWQGEFRKGKALLEEAVAGAREAMDRNYLTTGLYFLGPTLLMLGDYDGARAAGEELLTIGREAGNPVIESGALFVLGAVSAAGGDATKACDLFSEALELMRPMGQPFFEALFLISLSTAEMAAGSIEAARRHMEEALQKARRVRIKWILGKCHWIEARLARVEGDPAKGEEPGRLALALQREIGDKMGIVDSLEALAAIKSLLGDPEQAVILYGAAQSIREEVGYGRFLPERPVFESDLEAIRSTLGSDRFEAAWSRGISMRTGEAVQYVLGD